MIRLCFVSYLEWIVAHKPKNGQRSRPIFEKSIKWYLTSPQFIDQIKIKQLPTSQSCEIYIVQGMQNRANRTSRTRK